MTTEGVVEKVQREEKKGVQGKASLVERQERDMLVAKMAGKRFQADLPGAPSRRWTPPGSSLSPPARLTPTACLSVPPKLELEVLAGVEAVRRRAQAELRTRQRCKIGSRNSSPRNRRHPRAMMAEAAAEDLVAEEVTLAGTLEAAQASRREAPTEEELGEQRPLSRCVTSWAPSQPGLSQSWVPTPHSRGKTLLPEVRVWWPLKRLQACL